MDFFFNNIRSIWKDAIPPCNDGVDTFETLLRLGLLLIHLFDRMSDNVWKRNASSAKTAACLNFFFSFLIRLALFPTKKKKRDVLTKLMQHL